MKSLVVVGSGNVGTRLAHALKPQGYEIIQVYSRSLHNAKVLADQLSCEAVNQVDFISPKGDLYLVSLADDAYPSFVQHFKKTEALIVHTSGSLEMDVLEPCSPNYGVLYPFQSFSKDRMIDLSMVPFLIDASNDESLDDVAAIADSLSKQVYHLNDEQRRIYHLTGVFANNFVNRLYHIAADICEEEDLDFDLLKPLIRETAEKAIIGSPREMQTGPAKRKDEQILNIHYKMLASDVDQQKIYQVLSESIMKAQEA